MAERTVRNTGERIRKAAAEFVRQGEDIRTKVRDLTLGALRDQRFDPKGMRDVVRAVTQGLAGGVETGSSNMRSAFAEGLKGIDEALVRSAEAGGNALKQLASTGRKFSDNELKAALADLKRLEDDFVSTVSQVADAASSQVQPELRGALSTLLESGTATGKQLASTTNEFAHSFAAASLDATISGIDMAGEFGKRFADLASGLLSGVAETLQKTPDPGKPKPGAKTR
jgi:hypothetical protein